MKELLDKLSSYNIFNYLFPGIISCVASESLTTQVVLLQQDLVHGVFIYYLVGLVISRFGSLVLQPLLKKTGFIRFSNYQEYIEASKEDEKIGVFLETSNMYRTLSATFLLLFLVVPLEWLYIQAPNAFSLMFVLFLAALFLYSFRKQSSYISARVEKYVSGKQTEKK